MRAIKLPDDDRSCGWIATLPPLPPPRRLAGAVRADCAVIGAGFTGLAVARRLATHRPEWRIVVLDAQRAGLSGSGRNSGFVVDVGHYDVGRGVEGNRRLVRLGRAGLEQLRALVRAHGIDCAWSERGRLHGAVGAFGLRALDEFFAGLDAMGEPYERLDAAGVTAITGMTGYRAGARTPGAVLMQPAALARGLVDTLPENVDLYEESPVRAIRCGAHVELEVAGGRVASERVFVATNGFTPALGFLRRRLLPTMTFASLTRPLTGAESAALGGEPEWGLVCEAQMGTTVRRTRDQRLLIRNTVRYRPSLRVGDGFLPWVGARHRRALRARFPMLPDVEFEYTWGGVLGVSLKGAHFFGRLDHGLFAAAGYNGVGVAMGTVAGTLLADLAVGAESPLLADMQALPPPAPLPQPVRGIGVRIALALLQARARDE